MIPRVPPVPARCARSSSSQLDAAREQVITAAAALLDCQTCHDTAGPPALPVQRTPSPGAHP